MVTRIISGVVLALIVAPLVLFLPNLYFLIAILIAIGIACHELSQLFIKANEPIIPIFTDIAVSCLACSLYSGDSEIILAAVILIVTIAFIIVISKGEKGDMKAALNSIFVITFLAAPLVSLALIHNEIQGELIVFTLIFANAACDIGGYTVGKLLGSRKLAPSISPHIFLKIILE
ncbi:MAG: phosphatidate cytidylyltransferase [Nitrospinota bacterium]